MTCMEFSEKCEHSNMAKSIACMGNQVGLRLKKLVRSRLWQDFYANTQNFELHLLGSGWSLWAFRQENCVTIIAISVSDLLSLIFKIEVQLTDMGIDYAGWRKILHPQSEGGVKTVVSIKLKNSLSNTITYSFSFLKKIYSPITFHLIIQWH